MMMIDGPGVMWSGDVEARAGSGTGRGRGERKENKPESRTDRGERGSEQCMLEFGVSVRFGVECVL